MITEDLGTSNAVNEVIVGAAKLGAVVGTILGAAVMSRFGRRIALLFDTVFFVLGPVIMVASINAVGLVIGRLIVGVGIGASAVVVPAYLGEISPASSRGRIVASYEVMLCLGVVSSALVNSALDGVPAAWRWMVGAPLMPAVVMLCSVWKIPESPRWLVTQDKLEEALQVMHKVHTAVVLPEGSHSSTADVEAELLHLWSSVQKEKYPERDNVCVEMSFNNSTGTQAAMASGNTELDDVPLLDAPGVPQGKKKKSESQSRYGDSCIVAFFFAVWNVVKDIYYLCQSDEKKTLFIVLWLAFFNQACASTSILNYAPTLFQNQGMDSTALATLSSASLGLSKLVGVCISFMLIDSLGRRPLLLWGSVGCAMSLILLALSDFLGSVPIIIITMCSFVLFFSLSWAGVFWVILSEVFSMTAKSPAAAAATAVLFLSGSLTDFLFLSLESWIGCFSFLIYASMAACGGFFVFFSVPETKGLTLLEVQHVFNPTGPMTQDNK